jgi:hypothetical protein
MPIFEPGSLLLYNEWYSSAACIKTISLFDRCTGQMNTLYPSDPAIKNYSLWSMLSNTIHVLDFPNVWL